MRELLAVLSLMWAGYLFTESAHRVVQRFFEPTAMAGLEFEQPWEEHELSRSIRRSDVLAHARKHKTPLRPRPVPSFELETTAFGSVTIEASSTACSSGWTRRL